MSLINMTIADYTLEHLIEPVKIIAQQAGKAILAIYQHAQDQLIELKQDGSPLTKADQLANELITKALAQLTPNIPILSEEAADIAFSERVSWERYWLVDPLDGTKEFLQGTGDFTVNIALVVKKHAVLGIVYVPVTDCCYFAAKNLGAFKTQGEAAAIAIATNSIISKKIRLLASRLHGAERLAAVLEKLPDYEIKQVGSSLKFCLVAEGKADIYPRLGITSEWDTAAAQCIVEQAGGAVIDLYGLSLQYNTRDSLQNPYFLAIGAKAYNWLHYFPISNNE